MSSIISWFTVNTLLKKNNYNNIRPISIKTKHNKNKEKDLNTIFKEIDKFSKKK